MTLTKNHHNIDNMIINVFGYNRSKHLYVTLDSIFRMRGIEKYPVSVMLVYSNKDIFEQQLYYISQFPISEIKVLYEKPHIYFNRMSQNKYFNSLNYDWYLLIEDDILLSSDSLEYLEQIEKFAFVDCLYSLDYIENNSSYYRSGQGNVFANLYSRSSLETLTKWLSSNMVAGLIVPEINKPMCLSQEYLHFSYDTRIGCFIRALNIVESVPTKSKCLHFGLNAVIENELRNQIDSQMFSGDKTLWLTNVLGVLAKYKDDPSVTIILRPFNFQYE
jgi:hypothetical protein